MFESTTNSAVKVVPMPRTSIASSAYSPIWESIVKSELRSKSSTESESISELVSTGLSFCRALIAIFDATSPPACPPIPSATAIRRPETKAESSFPLRCKPSAERALLWK